MKKENKIFYTFRIYSEQLEYIKQKAKSEYTTVTQYILNLITNDMKNNNTNEKNNMRNL